MKMKKFVSIISAASLAVVLLAGCSGNTATQTKTTAKATLKALKEIAVVSREAGSGTRGAFIELTGVEVKEASGSKVDKTTTEAIIANKTDVVLASVAGNEAAIGYISLGSLNSNVKAVKINGIPASPDNVKNKTYAISRPFNIAYKGELTGVAADLVKFIMSAEGQKVVSLSYITINDKAPAFTSDMSSGKIVIAGSSSVSPLMEKLVEAYKAINTKATIEIQTSDSTAGMTAAMNGTCNIGMSSRDLKDTEKAALNSQAIALDGIAVIVNKVNGIENLTLDQVKKIYTGEITSWQNIQ
ncbi:MAG TPA: phosphate ABC transporter substrate-binding protein [Clostridiales bacterium]|nr:phosphate ABC transporter substrate-binding protein [Clostridiales bacterium]